MQAHFIKHHLHILRLEVALARFVPVLEDSLDVGSGLVAATECTYYVLDFREVDLAISGGCVTDLN